VNVRGRDVAAEMAQPKTAGDWIVHITGANAAPFLTDSCADVHWLDNPLKQRDRQRDNSILRIFFTSISS
jgi:hypothetical protein